MAKAVDAVIDGAREALTPGPSPRRRGEITHPALELWVGYRMRMSD